VWHAYRAEEKAALEKVAAGLLYGIGFGIAAGTIYYFISEKMMASIWNDKAIEKVVITQHEKKVQGKTLVQVLGTVENQNADAVRGLSIQVDLFDQSGKFLGKWTDIGAPWGIYYGKRENVLYMCDGLNNRISKLNLDGQILGVLGSHGKKQGKFDFAHNIAVDSSGAIYVAEIKNWRVQKFVPK